MFSHLVPEIITLNHIEFYLSLQYNCSHINFNIDYISAFTTLKPFVEVLQRTSHIFDLDSFVNLVAQMMLTQYIFIIISVIIGAVFIEIGFYLKDKYGFKGQTNHPPRRPQKHL